MGIHHRARKIYRSMHPKKRALLSLSQTLFALFIAVTLVGIAASYMSYGRGSLLLYALAAVGLLCAAYFTYLLARDVSFLDYFLIMFFSGFTGEDTPVGIHGSILFLGGLFIAVSPLIYSYLSRHGGPAVIYTTGFLTLGAILSVIAVIWYVRRLWE